MSATAIHMSENVFFTVYFIDIFVLRQFQTATADLFINPLYYTEPFAEMIGGRGSIL